jgi:hypothetical protein
LIVMVTNAVTRITHQHEGFPSNRRRENGQVGAGEYQQRPDRSRRNECE